MNGVQILLIAAVGIAVAAVAHRRGVEPGMIIVTLAAAASFIPGMPRLELGSELILAIVVPPLLYSAARGASFSAFGANLRPIFTLGVLLVVLTTGVLGLLASWLLPSIGLAAAFVLGAVLAPPDTITTARPAADPDASFEQQRLALGKAVAERRLAEEVARDLIEDIDLRQAARHAAE